MNIYEAESHIKKRLIEDHTKGVEKQALILHNTNTVRISALSHDFGKWVNHTNFNLKLKGANTKDLYTNHSYLSFYSLLTYAFQYGLKSGEIKDISELLIILTTILKHHGGLPDFENILTNKEELKRMLTFIRGGKYNSLTDFLKAIHFKTSDTVDFKFIKKGNPYTDIDIERDITSLYSPKNVKNYIKDPLDFFLELRMNFSAVVSADKYDAGNQEKSEKRYCMNNPIPILDLYSRVNKFCESFKNDSELNNLRAQIRLEDVNNLKTAMKKFHHAHTFSLTEPTGSGKTAILMQMGSEILKEKFTDKDEPKIIYGVPFLSITEQVYDIILKKIFEGEEKYLKRIDSKAEPGIEADDTEKQEKLLLKIIRKILGKQTIEQEHIDKILLNSYLEQTFDFPVIVTTFVQIFQGLTTASNRGLMRYAGFKNCVFLIDEIQSLPPRLYTFFTAFLDAFCKKFNSYAVISTATMPKFDLPNDGSTFSKEARELFHDYTTPIEVGNPTHFDNNIFNRYKIIPIQQDLTIAGLVNRVIEEKGSTMVILNTIRSSRDVFNLIKRCNIIPSDKIFLLNTLFCSDDRTAKLEKIKKLLENNEKIILVTTQVIEAGVDIDFNTVYRDIAPLPNIIQSAGRCNRNGKLPFGTVHVFKLIDETNKNMLFARYIYKGLDEVFLNNSMEVFFNSKDEFEEKYLFEYQKNHFNFINQKTVFGNWADNKNFVTQIKSFQYKEIGKFSIINKNMYEDQVQFYIPKDENDNNYEKMIDMYADMKVSEELPDKNHDSMKDILARDQELRAQRKSMQGRVVQCNVKDPLELRELSAYPNESGEPLFKLYKLNLDKYNSEFGILINKGELYV